MSKKLSLAHLLKKGNFPKLKGDEAFDKKFEELQLKMLRSQQGIYHQKHRAIIVLEGFDAAGKGGAIRRMVEPLDPRGYMVHPVGPPESEEQGRHYLYRFWQKLPSPGTIAIFDRSWYGRVLVEKVEKLAAPKRLQQAYQEIREFEELLIADGVQIIKIFIAISKDEQLQRFEDRLKDPYKNWKITKADVDARKRWNDYVKATDEMFAETSTKHCRWHLVAGNDKDHARYEVLKIITEELSEHRHWMEKQSKSTEVPDLKKMMRELGVR